MAGTIVANQINTDTGLFSTNNAYSGIAKAWVTFTGNTPSCSILASFNISSVSYNGAGSYTVNFTTAMPDSYYAVSGATSSPTGSNGPRFLDVGSGQYSDYSKTTTAFNCQTVYPTNGAKYDSDYVYVVVNR